MTSCNYDYIVGQDGSAPSNASGTPTGVFGYDTTLTLTRVCLPSSVTLTYFDGLTSSSTSSSVTSSVSGGYLSNLIQDITNNWQILLAGFGAAIILSFIVMLFLRWFTGCMVWLSILGLLVFLIGLGFILCYSGGLFGQQSISYLGYTIPKISSSS